MEFSKIILLTVAAVTAIVIIASFALMFYTQTVDPLNAIIVGLFTAVDTAIGFYYWKARKENELKILNSHGKEVHEKVFEKEEY